MDILNLLAGPLVGAVIGYFTNYIAVKMLFRPFYPVKLGKWTLPFTPGIIPSRKPQLAKAVGKAVGENLITGNDLEEMLLSEEMECTVANEISAFLYKEGSDGPRNLKNLLQPRMGEEAYAVNREHLEESICDKILKELGKLDMGSLVAEEGTRVLREKTKGTLLEMMISDDMIQSIARPIGEHMNIYIQDNGHDMLLPMIDHQIEYLENKSLADYLSSANVEEEKLHGTIRKMYREIVKKKAGELISRFDVASIVEEKINAMDMKEVESLVLSVMENELNAIVRLGAVIGFVIGIANVFV